jgi:hypothetical protein
MQVKVASSSVPSFLWINPCPYNTVPFNYKKRQGREQFSTDVAHSWEYYHLSNDRRTIVRWKHIILR